MLNLKNTLDGYLKNVEVIGNTIQDTNNLADIRSVGDKVEGQELYKIDVLTHGKNLNSGFELGDLSASDGTLVISSTKIRSIEFIKIDILNSYNIHRNGINEGFNVYCYNDAKDFLGLKTKSNGLFTSSDFLEGTKYVKFVKTSTDTTNIQLEEGTVATPYEPYKGDKLEILSPVQLEKVGDVADRIICKDGVWGIEKNIGILTLSGQEVYDVYAGGSVNRETVEVYFVKNIDYNTLGISRLCIDSDKVISNKFTGYVYCWDSNKINTLSMHPNLNNIYFTVDSSIDTITKFKEHIKGTIIKFPTLKPQFIPLPHDQQVKLRTFAGQTNVCFNTEIPGQIKAQVPKSLGAVVNTHTEQIEMLHNALKSVLAGDMYSLATILYPEDFEQNDNTEQDIMVIPE